MSLPHWVLVHSMHQGQTSPYMFLQPLLMHTNPQKAGAIMFQQSSVTTFSV